MRGSLAEHPTATMLLHGALGESGSGVVSGHPYAVALEGRHKAAVSRFDGCFLIPPDACRSRQLYYCPVHRHVLGSSVMHSGDARSREFGHVTAWLRKGYEHRSNLLCVCSEQPTLLYPVAYVHLRLDRITKSTGLSISHCMVWN